MNDNGSIILKGWLASGRVVEIVIPSHGDAQRDISDIFAIDRMLSDAGISPRETEPEAGEKSEQVDYIVRSSSENKRGESIVLYLYTERFTKRFLKVYINNPEEKAAFEQLSGLTLASVPYYSSEDQPFDRNEAPNKAKQFLVKLPRTVRAYFKPNPQYNPDEPDIKKRKPKNLFTHWGAGAGQTTQTTQTGQTAGVSTQTDARQTPRQTGQASNGGVSEQTGSRQTGQTRQTAQNKDDGFTRLEALTHVDREKREKGSYLIRTPENSFSWSRDPFKAAGINIGEHQVGSIDLGGRYNILAKRDDRGYYMIQSVTPAAAHPPGGDLDFMPEGDIDQWPAPPNYDPDEPF